MDYKWVMWGRSRGLYRGEKKGSHTDAIGVM